MYTVSIDFGAGAVDCTDYLVGQYPVKRSRSIHNGLKPVIGTCKFALHRNTSLINDFLTATTDPEVTILHDGAAFFKGTIRRTVKVDVGQIRVQGIECQCVDPLYRLDSKLTRTSFTWSNYKISDPTTKTASILHQLFYLAGFSDAELNLSAIDTVVDAYSVDGTGKAVSIRGLIETVLRDAVYSLRVTNSGVVELYDLAPTTYAATMTLLTGSGGNIAEGYSVARDEYKAEAVDVKYWTHKTIADAVVFEDTTGRTASLPCSIPVAAGQYYPEGADASTTIRCVFEYPDYDLVSVASPAVEWSHTGDVTKDVETIDGLGMLIRFSSATGGVITKLKIVGDATVKWTENKIVSEIVASSDERETIESDIITSQTDAERLAAGRAAWHKNATFVYTFNRLTLAAYSSDTLYPASTLTPDTDLYPSGDILLPGDIVQITDTGLLGASQLARVLRVDDGADLKTFTAVCEAVGAYSETPVVQSPVFPRPGSPMATEIGAADDAQARADAAQAAAEAAAIVAIPVYTPAYLGAFRDSSPGNPKEGDVYLRYSATPNTVVPPTIADPPDYRGVFRYTSGTWVWTTGVADMYLAIRDIVDICRLLDTADPPAALYGAESDYGITASIDTAYIKTAMIDYLRGGDAYFTGNIDANDGTFRGTLDTPILQTQTAQDAGDVSVPTPSYWRTADLIDHWPGISGEVAASGTFNGKTVSNVLIPNADTVNFYTNDAEVSGGATGWYTLKSYTSAVDGLSNIYVNIKRYNLPGAVYQVQILVNSIVLYDTGYVYTSDPNYQQFSVTTVLAAGDSIVVREYCDTSAEYKRIFAKEFRVAPAENTIGIRYSDASCQSIRRYEPSGADAYLALTGTITPDTYSEFASADHDDYWLGLDFINEFDGKISPYVEQAVDGGTWSVDTPVSVYIAGNSYMNISYASGSPTSVVATTFYNHTGYISLLDTDPVVLLGNDTLGRYELWPHNIPGSDKGIITLRNKNESEGFSIGEIRNPTIDANAWAPSTAYTLNTVVKNGAKFYRCSTAGTSAGSGGPTGTSTSTPVTDGTAQWVYVGTESTMSLHIYPDPAGRDWVRDVSLHNYSGNMHGVDAIYNFNDTTAADWKWVEILVGSEVLLMRLYGATGNLWIKGNLSADGTVQPSGGYKSADGSTGASGTFTTANSKTVTVKNGIITSIV